MPDAIGGMRLRRCSKQDSHGRSTYGRIPGGELPDVGGSMSGQSWIEATADQRAELRGLAGSSDREEADRARAVLLSLEGWTSERIAAAFCVQADGVRHWRWIFGRAGVTGLRARKAPGAEPKKA